MSYKESLGEFLKYIFSEIASVIDVLTSGKVFSCLHQAGGSRKDWNICLLCSKKTFRSWSLRWAFCFSIAGVFLDLILLKQMLGEFPWRMSTDSAHVSVLLIPGMVVRKNKYFPRVCVWPRKWHWKTKELEISTFFHCFMVGWNECFRWACVKLCFVLWSQIALFWRKGCG